MINLKGFEYKLAIQALELQDDKALIEIAKEFDASPYASEYIKNWNILFNDLPFIAKHIEKNGHCIRGVINEYGVITFSSLENALAEMFIDIVLDSILLKLSSKRQHKDKK